MYLTVYVYRIIFIVCFHPVETDKDPTQSLICEVPEKKLSTTQITEQKEALPSEECIALQEVAAELSSGSTQPGDICARSTTETAKLPETNIQSADMITEQCKFASLAILQQAAPQDKSLPLISEKPQQMDMQTSICPSTDTICKSIMQEVITSAQTDNTLPSAETKSETPISAIQATMLPVVASIDADSSKIIASPNVTQPLTIDPSEQHAEMLLAASEVSTVSPVPIQVAESVLQTEPKESVSSAIVSDQAIATTVTAVHESTNIALAAATAEPIQFNGSACEIKERGNIAPVSTMKADAPVESIKQSVSDMVVTKDAPSEISVVTAEKVQPGSEEISSKEEVSSTTEKSMELAKTAIVEVAQIAKTEVAEAKPMEQIAKIEEKEDKFLEEIAKAESMETKPIKPVETTETAEAIAATKSQSEIPESPPITEQTSPLAKPIEAKELNIPSTPTVIEATPPVSPLVEAVQELEEKSAKKSLKKSDSTDGTEADGDDKKTKKTVKKAVKKSKTKTEEAVPPAAVAEGAAAAESSQGKMKKSVKVTKKTGLKIGQSLETDTNVSDTPAPSSPATTTAPDVPVPPKRKTKGNSTSGTSSKGVTGKKSEAEE